MMNLGKTIHSTTIILAITLTLSGAETKVTVSGARLLVKSADVISAKYGIPINYEDIGPAEMRPDDQRADSSSPNSMQLHLRDIDSLSHRPEAVLPIVAASILDYRGINSAAVYRALLSDDQRSISIVPGDRPGAESPLFDRRMSVKSGTRLVSQVLETFCAELSKAGVPVRIGTIPINLFAQTSTTLSGNETIARQVLQDALNTLTWTDERLTARVTIPKLQWRLLYDATLNSFFLNIIPVTEEVSTPQGNTMRQSVRDH
jgi:hypothetical protein